MGYAPEPAPGRREAPIRVALTHPARCYPLEGEGEASATTASGLRRLEQSRAGLRHAFARLLGAGHRGPAALGDEPALIPRLHLGHFREIGGGIGGLPEAVGADRRQHLDHGGVDAAHGLQLGIAPCGPAAPGEAHNGERDRAAGRAPERGDGLGWKLEHDFRPAMRGTGCRERGSGKLQSRPRGTRGRAGPDCRLVRSG